MSRTSNSEPTNTEVPPWAAGTAERMHELDPELDDAEIEILRAYGEERRYAEGEILWQAGDRGPFLLVLEGSLEIFYRADGEEHAIIHHSPRHYVGELITMSGGRALVNGRATSPLRALVLEPGMLRLAIAKEAELGEKLLLSFILRRMRMVAERLSDIRLVGDPDNLITLHLQGFLSRNGVPFEQITNPAEIESALAKVNGTSADLPAVISNDTLLSRPSNRELAEHLGFTVDIDCGVTYDVAVVGSGPAGLTAAVYAASEGLSAIVLEHCAPGGQAASSSRIENYMGFPTGITGQALMGRGYIQAQKFGAHIAVARKLEALECGDPLHKLRIDGGDIVYARSVVLASGAIYRQPSIPGLDAFGGVHYGASHIEGELCRGANVGVIGGGNSAGQAAMFLSRKAKHVNILIRGKDLSHSMSAYLIDRIDATPNITVHPYTEVREVLGDGHVERVTLADNRSGDTRSMDISHLFVFIGATPGTGFLNDGFLLDDKGFVLTGNALDRDQLDRAGWKLERSPYHLETSCPRVFAAGDVRSGSTKRVASAVGEGSVCVQYIHQVMDEAAAS